MTDQYSIENYLVTDSVLDKTLQNEFDCHGLPDVRNSVCEQFKRSYADFLQVTSEINRRLFFARRHEIELQKPITTKITPLATVSLKSVTSGNIPVEDIIKLSEPWDEKKTVELNSEFDQLSRAERYRGKFAFLFFVSWLNALADDRRSDASIFFKNMSRDCKIPIQTFTAELMASRSALPNGLRDFLNAMPAAIRVATLPTKI